MALLKQKLVTNIREICDKDFEGFKGFPETELQVGERWANAILSYFQDVQPPLSPLAIQTTYEAVKNAVIALKQANSVTLLEQAIQAGAVQVALGMQPAFTGTPPAAPLSFAAVYAVGLSGGSAKDCAEMLAEILHTWTLTGTAVNNASGAPLTWL